LAHQSSQCGAADFHRHSDFRIDRLIVVIAAELLASADSGIGSYILFVSMHGGHMDSVFAGAAIAGILGVLINSFFGLIDRRLFAWRYLGAVAQ
jgi:ABC-type nitrate/sulfonate/bicarbonate transport system permease component